MGFAGIAVAVLGALLFAGAIVRNNVRLTLFGAALFTGGLMLHREGDQ